MWFSVCFDSWMDTQCSHAKELRFNPGIGETSQLSFLACCHTSQFAAKQPPITAGDALGLRYPLLAVFIASSSNEQMRLSSRGSRAATANTLAAELFQSTLIIYNRFS